eukprot:GEMP01066592.1.p1 GENE.GEMP01066592.1~~GEMP01066592.1.p1  ORF type:complete len:251 (+),score=45.51 GEMP01066592.1:70-822(+)
MLNQQQTLLLVRADGDAEAPAKNVTSTRLPGTTSYATPANLLTSPPSRKVHSVAVFRENPAAFTLDVGFFSAILQCVLPGGTIMVYANDATMEMQALFAGVCHLSYSNGILTGRAPEWEAGAVAEMTPMDIDEEELPLAPVNQVGKGKESCATKKRACATCNCGRKDLEEKVGFEEAKKMLEQGTQRSACGSCYLGDAFRCASCPYRGKPAFKAGSKVELDEPAVAPAPELNPDAPMTSVTAGGTVKLAI